MLLRAARHAGPAWNGRILFGSMLAGWGLFNFVEGLIDHQLLGIHHVLPGHPYQLWFDLLYLAAGVALFMMGARLIRSPRNATDWQKLGATPSMDASDEEHARHSIFGRLG